METANCVHCERTITETSSGWADMQATGDDKIWKYVCDMNDTMFANHDYKKEAS